MAEAGTPHRWTEEEVIAWLADAIDECTDAERKKGIVSPSLCDKMLWDAQAICGLIERPDVSKVLRGNLSWSMNGDFELSRRSAIGEVLAMLTEALDMLVGDRVQSPNGRRDEWMHRSKQEGKTHGEIRAMLKRDHSNWDQLETEQAVGRAIDRYCKRNKLPLVRRKK